MGMEKTRGLTFIGTVAVVCGLLVVASFLADGQAMRHEMLEKGNDASGLDRRDWSGEGPDDASGRVSRPLTWGDVIRSNYPTEPNFDPSVEELYRKNPLSFLRVVRPGSGSSMLALEPEAPNSLDRAKDRWYMAGQYDDHARELHGRVPQIGRYVQAGYPSDYANPSSFPLGAPEYAVVPRGARARQQQLWNAQKTAPYNPMARVEQVDPVNKMITQWESQADNEPAGSYSDY